MKIIICDNCYGIVDDYYYRIAGFTIKTCSVSCMAEFLCKNKIGNIKIHINAIEKINLKEHAI